MQHDAQQRGGGAEFVWGFASAQQPPAQSTTSPAPAPQPAVPYSPTQSTGSASSLYAVVESGNRHTPIAPLSPTVLSAAVPHPPPTAQQSERAGEEEKAESIVDAHADASNATPSAVHAQSAGPTATSDVTHAAAAVEHSAVVATEGSAGSVGVADTAHMPLSTATANTTTANTTTATSDIATAVPEGTSTGGTHTPAGKVAALVREREERRAETRTRFAAYEEQLQHWSTLRFEQKIKSFAYGFLRSPPPRGQQPGAIERFVRELERDLLQEPLFHWTAQRAEGGSAGARPAGGSEAGACSGEQGGRNV